VNKDRIIDRLRANPTFFVARKVDKLELGEFFVEYASLMEDEM
jgi:hypothetical protein